MNKKIKEIDIGNFRAYKDLQRFNFTYDNGRKIADLVAIYAPNGYGKTSFFDAIEWAVTDKIGRLEGGKPVEEERKSEKDYILKNKDVDAELYHIYSFQINILIFDHIHSGRITFHYFSIFSTAFITGCILKKSDSCIFIF